MKMSKFSLENNAGIYYFCSPSGKFYVGSSVNVRMRYYAYRNRLKANQNDQPKLYNSFRKYGLEAHQFYLLEVVEDEAKLTEREQFWVDFLKPELNCQTKIYRAYDGETIKTPQERREHLQLWRKKQREELGEEAYLQKQREARKRWVEKVGKETINKNLREWRKRKKQNAK